MTRDTHGADWQSEASGHIMSVAEPRVGDRDLDLPAKVAFLSQARNYPHGPASVSIIETHKSFVFVADYLVFKLKKPIQYNSADFRGLDARHTSCEEEVRLNRRLASSVYLGVVPLTRNAHGRLELSGINEPIEWLVMMRRLPGDRMLDRLITEQRLLPGEIDALAIRLSVFYQSCPPLDISGAEYRALLEAEIKRSDQALATVQLLISSEEVKAIMETLYRYLADSSAMFDRRASWGKIVEGHGDLRPEHICLEPLPVVIDCLDFDPVLRIIDPVDELCFLGMGCARLGARSVTTVLLRTFERVTSDRPPRSLLDFYTAYRASTWARLAVWRTATADPAVRAKWLRRADEYLAIAEPHCARLRQRAR